MSFLYPRLLTDQARPLHEEYQHLTISELTARAATSHGSAVYVATGGDRVPADRLRQLRGAVLDLAVRAGFPEGSDRASNAEFDVEVAALLHGEAGMVPAEAASRDVWAFLALVLLPDVAHWRYPRPPKDRVMATDLTRHVFGRLWWRAQLVRDPESPTPYAALSILGEAAFDQIYARRAALGGSPHLVRSILRVWKELDLEGLNERRTLQDFLKRLLRLAPFVLFDAVEERALDHELRAVAHESVAAQHPEGARSAGAEVPSPRKGLDDTGITSRPAGDTGPRSVAPSSADAAPRSHGRFRSVELCAGAGAQALGLELAGFDPVLLIDNKADACATIAHNRPHWDVLCTDVAEFDPQTRPDTTGVDLLSAGLPRLASVARARRADDSEERRVLATVVELAVLMRPQAVLLENLPELVESDTLAADRQAIEHRLGEAGYRSHWKVLNAADFGVSQNRRSGFLVALRTPGPSEFSWPIPHSSPAPGVGTVLGPSMASNGWPGADRWAHQADVIAPMIIGGSDRRGGADLGPTGSKKAWAALRVNGQSLRDEPPGVNFAVDGQPRLTVEQAAMVQAIPADWRVLGLKTSRYRQIGHAMPPPLAAAVGHALRAALGG